jgi:uncharacterized repeat protein (TIGR02543 family)
VVLGTPTRVGHTFNGWYTAQTGGTRVGGGGSSWTPTSDSNITLHAQWTAVTTTVRFINPGGTAVANQTYTFGSTITLPTPTRAGHTFTGWFTYGYQSLSYQILAGFPLNTEPAIPTGAQISVGTANSVVGSAAHPGSVTSITMRIWMLTNPDLILVARWSVCTTFCVEWGRINTGAATVTTVQRSNGNGTWTDITTAEFNAHRITGYKWYIVAVYIVTCSNKRYNNDVK